MPTGSKPSNFCNATSGFAPGRSGIGRRMIQAGDVVDGAEEGVVIDLDVLTPREREPRLDPALVGYYYMG